MHEACLKASSEAKNSFWIEIRTVGDMAKFSADQSCLDI